MQAAGAVIRRDGVRAMTLQAVAREAGVSKGGLLYHFPSKRDLITAMVKARAHRLHNTSRRFEELHPGAGPAAAYVSTVAEAPPTELDAALLAAIFEDPALLEAYRQEVVEMYRRLAEGAGDPILAIVVGLACDGLWTNELLNTGIPDPRARAAVITRLAQLADATRGSSRVADGSESE